MGVSLKVALSVVFPSRAHATPRRRRAALRLICVFPEVRTRGRLRLLGRRAHSRKRILNKSLIGEHKAGTLEGAPLYRFRRDGAGFWPRMRRVPRRPRPIAAATARLAASTAPAGSKLNSMFMTRVTMSQAA